MSLLKTNEIQNYNGSSLTLTATTVSTSAQLNTGGNISVTGSLNVSDDSTTRTNLGLGTISTQDSSNVSVTGGSITGTTIVPTTPFSFRNRIINGNFDIWQRGTSQTNNGYGSADRWVSENIGSTKIASQQLFTNGQTDVPGNPKYYWRHVVTSVAGASNFIVADQRIEGVQTLAGQTATLSFWGKADSNKSIATEFSQGFGAGGSPSSRVESIGVTTHNLTTSWQKFTATVSIPHLTDTGLAGGSPKTIGTDGDDTLSLYFWFDAGSDYDSRANSLGQQSGTFDIAQVQVEEGTVATPFEHRPYGMELSLCQRYFMKVDGRAIAYRRHDTSCTCFMTFPQCMRLKQPVLENITKGTLTNFQSQSYGTINDNSIAASAESEMISRGFLYIDFYTDNTGHTFIPSWEGFNFDVNAEL